jgi:hypothetical protein
VTGATRPLRSESPEAARHTLAHLARSAPPEPAQPASRRQADSQPPHPGKRIVLSSNSFRSFPCSPEPRVVWLFSARASWHVFVPISSGYDGGCALDQLALIHAPSVYSSAYTPGMLSFFLSSSPQDEPTTLFCVAAQEGQERDFF